MKMSATGVKWHRLWETSASEIAEAAIILPLLFTLMFAIYWFGRAFSIYGTINHAARQAALTAASPVCANCSGNTWSNTGFPDDKTVSDVISQALAAANLDPTQVQPSTPNSPPKLCANVPAGCSTASPGNFYICRNAVLDDNSSSQTQACGMIVSFQYPYQFVLPFTSLNKQLINLQARAEMAGEN